MDDTGALIEVETFVYADAAKIAEALLRSESIPCYLRNESAFPTGAFWTENSSLLHLMVPISYAEQARDLLRSHVTDADLEDQADQK